MPITLRTPAPHTPAARVAVIGGARLMFSHDRLIGVEAGPWRYHTPNLWGRAVAGHYAVTGADLLPAYPCGDTAFQREATAALARYLATAPTR